MIRALAVAVEGSKRWKDRLAPGVVVSMLNQHEWYVSVVKYPEDGSKVVVCNARGRTFAQAVQACALAYLVTQQKAHKLNVSTADIRAALK